MTADEIKELVNSPDYYNRFDKNKNWEYILLLVGRPTQAAEINELQNLLEEKIKAIGKSFYEDEIIISGCEISVNTSTKKATIEAGKFFLDGLIYEVPKKTLTISTSEAQIGVVPIQANDEREAHQRARDAWNNTEIILNEDDFEGVEMSVLSEGSEADGEFIKGHDYGKGTAKNGR